MTAIGKCEVALGRSRVRPEASVFFALLLYLGMKAGSRIPRGELLELLWTDAPDAARRHALRQMVYRLRRAGLDVEADGSELVIDAGRVACDLARVCTDGWVASAALDDIPSPAAILPSYQHALTRPYSEWVDSIRAGAEAHIRRAALRHADAASREGRWDDVERAARLALAADSLNEAATLALAEATAMGGSKAEALRVLDAYLWEVGERDSAVGVPARLLRRRIADLPSFRIPRAADPPLIARSRELAWLNGQLELAAQGNAVTAMLVGAPGIGKTAVARTFMAHAEMRGWRPVTSRQQPSDVDRPMSIFVELLPALLKAEGALGAAPESIAQLRRLIEHRTEEDILSGKSQEAEAVQARIRSSLHDLLSAVTHEGPLICLLEDLHWIDNQSLKVLTWLVEHAPNLPVLWLLTARLESRFAELRAGFPDDRTPSLMIEPLDREAAATLFKSVASAAAPADVEAVAERAYSVTGGNPLFVREVAWHWTETGSAAALPTNLRALMRGRVSRLSPAAQRVLHCCAVLGRYATVPRVATVLEISTAELLSCIEEVDALGISGLGGEPGSLVLHDLWQEELASGLRPAPRALLHLRCGDVLSTESRGSPDAALFLEGARHLVAAGATKAALAFLEQAATYQMANGFADDAVGTTRRAFEIAAEGDDKERFHRMHAIALASVGAWPALLELERERIERITRGDSVFNDLSEVDIHLLEALWRTGQDPSVAMQTALAWAESDSSPLRVRLSACLLVSQSAANRFDVAALKRAAHVLQSFSVPEPGLCGIYYAAHLILESEIGDFTRAIEYGEMLVAHERRLGSVHGLARALRFASYPYRATGNTSRSLALAREAFSLASRNQLAEQAAQAADVCGSLLIAVGAVDDAETWAKQASHWAEKSNLIYSVRSVSLLRAEVALRRGDLATAERELKSIDSIAPQPTWREGLTRLALQASLYVAKRDKSGLDDVVRELTERLAHSRGRLRQDEFVVALVRAQLFQGRSADARAYVVDYVSRDRRDTAPLPSELAALTAPQFETP